MLLCQNAQTFNLEGSLVSTPHPRPTPGPHHHPDHGGGVWVVVNQTAPQHLKGEPLPGGAPWYRPPIGDPLLGGPPRRPPQCSILTIKPIRWGLSC